ncbi:MAG: hypothetical protein Q9227_007255 [Pyrenula ochraceoflavens]
MPSSVFDNPTRAKTCVHRTLTDMPPEVIALVFKALGPVDCILLALCCKYFASFTKKRIPNGPDFAYTIDCTLFCHSIEYRVRLFRRLVPFMSPRYELRALCREHDQQNIPLPRSWSCLFYRTGGIPSHNLVNYECLLSKPGRTGRTGSYIRYFNNQCAASFYGSSTKQGQDGYLNTLKDLALKKNVQGSSDRSHSSTLSTSESTISFQYHILYSRTTQRYSIIPGEYNAFCGSIETFGDDIEVMNLTVNIYETGYVTFATWDRRCLGQSQMDVSQGTAFPQVGSQSGEEPLASKPLASSSPSSTVPRPSSTRGISGSMRTLNSPVAHDFPYSSFHSPYKTHQAPQGLSFSPHVSLVHQHATMTNQYPSYDRCFGGQVSKPEQLQYPGPYCNGQEPLLNDSGINWSAAIFPPSMNYRESAG